MGALERFFPSAHQPGWLVDHRESNLGVGLAAQLERSGQRVFSEGRTVDWNQDLLEHGCTLLSHAGGHLCAILQAGRSVSNHL
jgi:hypothetical protein